jgi:5-methylcytosine-specific restriction endonuclease McrA
MREQLGSTARRHKATRPCPDCQVVDAVVIPRGGQNTVRCARCGKHTYNAPKTETGEKPRTVVTARRGVKPGQQARVFERDGGQCVFCRATRDLTLGHLVSVNDGVALGLSEADLNSDANLAAMCEACNLGLGRRSVLPRTYLRIMAATISLANQAEVLEVGTVSGAAAVGSTTAH